MFLIGQSVCIRQSGCIRAKMVVFGQKLMYSSKSVCIRAKVVVFGQKCLHSGKSGCILGKWL